MEEFVFMCGRMASKHDTALAHAMLHAVAVWVDKNPGDAAKAPRASYPRGHPPGAGGRGVLRG